MLGFQAIPHRWKAKGGNGIRPLKTKHSIVVRVPPDSDPRHRLRPPNPRRPRGRALRWRFDWLADGGGLGLRLVVPWGRPRAPLLPALGKPSPCYWRRQALLTPTGRASRKRPLRQRIARCRGYSRTPTPPARRTGPPPARAIAAPALFRTVAPLRHRRGVSRPTPATERVGTAPGSPVGPPDGLPQNRRSTKSSPWYRVSRQSLSARRRGAEMGGDPCEGRWRTDPGRRPPTRSLRLPRTVAPLRHPANDSAPLPDTDSDTFLRVVTPRPLRA